jgi:ankyrin repeat protein
VFLLGAGGDLPLVDAARYAGADAVRALIQKGANVNAAEADGTTPLHWAAHRDDLAAADLLIRAGARVNAANDLGATPLWAASLNGNPAMVRRLLEAGAKPDAALLAGETPVMVASRAGHAAVVEQLVAKGANLNARAARGQTALMWAVSQRHPAVVRVLLAHGADLHARSEVWSQVMAVPPHGLPQYNRTIPHGGDTALMFAARAGDLESAKLLVAAGANVGDADAWGVSATVLAAHAGYGELVEFLLAHGADPNAAKAGFSALHAAIMRRDEKMAAALLAHGADANAPLRTWTPTRRSSKDFHFPPEFVGATPFWLAARFGDTEIMHALADAGADTRFVMTDGSNPLVAAVAATSGFGSGDRRERYLTPVQIAEKVEGEEERVTLEAARLAIVLGADVNQQNQAGDTALHLAAAQGLVTVTQLLVEKGAALDVKNKRGLTPLGVATQRPRGEGGLSPNEERRQATAELLRKLGATE